MVEVGDASEASNAHSANRFSRRRRLRCCRPSSMLSMATICLSASSQVSQVKAFHPSSPFSFVSHGPSKAGCSGEDVRRRGCRGSSHGHQWLARQVGETTARENSRQRHPQAALRTRELHVLHVLQDDPMFFDPQPHAQVQSQVQPQGSQSAALPPIPQMPSQQFFRMAKAQLELLANSLFLSGSNSLNKIQSMGLYLPQENTISGQLEFTPAIVHPDPAAERVFIASDAASGNALTLPRTLTTLPGFETASSLLPGYPMISADSTAPTVGVIEEVMCDPTARSKAASLSIPLLSGPQTVGVLLVSPRSPLDETNGNNRNVSKLTSTRKGTKGSTSSASSSSSDGGGNSPNGQTQEESFWTEQDRAQISIAAQSLSMALAMDNERSILQQQNMEFRESLSNSLHQVKNPLQALRTYSKLLERRISTEEQGGDGIAQSSLPLSLSNNRGSYSLMDLTNNVVLQSERVSDLLRPIDSLVDRMDRLSMPYLIGPSTSATNGINGETGQTIGSLVLRQDAAAPLIETIENEALEYARVNATVMDGFSNVGDMFTTPPSAADSNANNGDQSASSVFSSALSTPTSSSPSASLIHIFGDDEVEIAFLSELLESTLTSFYTVSEEAGVAFGVIEEDDDLPGVSVSPKALKEALMNLLDNALKYVVLPKRGSAQSRNPSPQIMVRFLSNDQNVMSPGVTILVEDNGPGIASEERELVFRRGYRSRETQSVEGTGIGLDIARNIISRMGGTLTVEEPDGSSLGGTVMKIVLFRRALKQ